MNSIPSISPVMVMKSLLLLFLACFCTLVQAQTSKGIPSFYKPDQPVDVMNFKVEKQNGELKLSYLGVRKQLAPSNLQKDDAILFQFFGGGDVLLREFGIADPCLSIRCAEDDGIGEEKELAACKVFAGTVFDPKIAYVVVTDLGTKQTVRVEIPK
jgi:hypothetical protein